MKELKSAVNKMSEDTAKYNDIIAAEKEIELLKKRLMESKKKYNYQRKKNECFSNLLDLADANACLLKKRLFKSQAEIKSLETRVSMQIHMLLKESEILEQATKNYCNILINSSKNLYPGAIGDIEYHKAELKNIIKKLSSIADSEKNDLLKSCNIKEFMNNRN